MTTHAQIHKYMCTTRATTEFAVVKEVEKGMTSTFNLQYTDNTILIEHMNMEQGIFAKRILDTFELWSGFQINHLKS